MRLKLLEEIECYGHENLLGEHRSTLEVTKDFHLTKAGDCIIGVRSSKGCADLTEEVKLYLHQDVKFLIKLQVNAISDEFYGYGHEKLELTHVTDIVFRKSNYICPRTILISCSKSAMELKRDLIAALRNPNEKLKIEIYLVEGE